MTKSVIRFLATFLGKWAALFVLLTFSAPAQATYFSLPVLDTSMTDPIFRTLAAGFNFRPVEPASDLGRIFGLNLGISVTGVDASAVASTFGLQTSSTYLPMGDLQIGIGLPGGFTLETGFIPNLAVNGTSFSRYGGALQWTANRTVLKALPFNLAARLAYTTAKLDYSQTLQGGDIDVSYKTGIFSESLVISKRLLFFQPFLGIGMAEQSSSLSSSGDVSLFGASFPTGTLSINDSGSSFLFNAGFLLKIFVLGLAFEYDNVFSISSYTAKVSLRF